MRIRIGVSLNARRDPCRRTPSGINLEAERIPQDRDMPCAVAQSARLPGGSRYDGGGLRRDPLRLRPRSSVPKPAPEVLRKEISWKANGVSALAAARRGRAAREGGFDSMLVMRYTIYCIQ